MNRPLALALAAAWEERQGARIEIVADDDALLFVLPEDADARALLAARRARAGRGAAAAQARDERLLRRPVPPERAARAPSAARRRRSGGLRSGSSRQNAKRLLEAVSALRRLPAAARDLAHLPRRRVRARGAERAPARARARARSGSARSAPSGPRRSLRTSSGGGPTTRCTRTTRRRAAPPRACAATCCARSRSKPRAGRGPGRARRALPPQGAASAPRLRAARRVRAARMGQGAPLDSARRMARAPRRHRPRRRGRRRPAVGRADAGADSSTADPIATRHGSRGNLGHRQLLPVKGKFGSRSRPARRRSAVLDVRRLGGGPERAADAGRRRRRRSGSVGAIARPVPTLLWKPFRSSLETDLLFGRRRGGFGARRARARRAGGGGEARRGCGGGAGRGALELRDDAALAAGGGARGGRSRAAAGRGAAALRRLAPGTGRARFGDRRAAAYPRTAVRRRGARRPLGAGDPAGAPGWLPDRLARRALRRERAGLARRRSRADRLRLPGRPRPLPAARRSGGGPRRRIRRRSARRRARGSFA